MSTEDKQFWTRDLLKSVILAVVGFALGGGLSSYMASGQVYSLRKDVETDIKEIKEEIKNHTEIDGHKVMDERANGFDDKFLDMKEDHDGDVANIKESLIRIEGKIDKMIDAQ